ncbi:hypothetical protein F8388_022408 [Cannabis sativa]|uniref:Uncharacterized protein n=1 Tax=Cannabis sativa TaxID=3483 RepID=A0A7J6HLT9_CANSA|nr:hypothetical protein F8388_022408 [Cannabis sativa]KAF4396224.1 hypothetical protein G4B88_020861 [Cannabis sativa]
MFYSEGTTSKVCTFFSSSNQLAFRLKMSRRIEAIKKRLTSISNDRNFLLDKGRQDISTVRRVRDTYSFVRHEDVILIWKVNSQVFWFMPKNSINDLLNLQTLKLHLCSKLKELPRDIRKLINLRHLDISDCYKLEYMPRGLGQLTNLRKLSKFVLMKSEKCITRHGAGLKELMRLNNLRGELLVTNLTHEKDVAAEYEGAKLKDKQYLRSLRLEWDSEAKIDETEAIVGYEMSLEGLQPHQNIQNLRLTNYGGVKLSSWLASLTNLVKLTLVNCKKCQYLVSMSQLKHLALLSLVSLEYISNTNMSEDLLGSKTALLPSLQTLRLNNLPNLKGWWREAEEEKQMSFPYLPSLSKLIIKNCPKVACMPVYLHLKGKLHLEESSWKRFEETFRMMMMMSSNVGSIFPATSSFSPLSKLERLDLIRIDDIECLPNCFKSFTSLNFLNIDSCLKLKDLCPGILHLSSLRHLQITNCEGLGDMLISDDDYDFMWQSLNGTLQSLQLRMLPNIMTVLPKGIQHLTSLQQLQVYSSDSLTTIPEWIHNLKSLQSLWLSKCPNLTSFPEGIQSLTTLNKLMIHTCPMLLKRCKRETGEDWDKISHIRDLDLNPDPNKEENENPSDHQTNGCNLFNNSTQPICDSLNQTNTESTTSGCDSPKLPRKTDQLKELKFRREDPWNLKEQEIEREEEEEEARMKGSQEWH